MPRPPADYRAVHAEAARFEPRVSRAIARAVEKMRDHVSINELAMALSTKNAKWAEALLTKAYVDDVLSPASAIVIDAVLRGGRVGAERVNRALEAL